MGQHSESFEQEQATLGAILLTPAELADVAEVLVPEDFANTPFREIYSAMLALDEDGVKPETAALVDHLGAEKYSEAIRLISLFAPENNAKFYAKAVRNKSLKRRIVETASRMIGLTKEAHCDAGVLLDEFEQRIMALRVDRNPGAFKPVGAILSRTIARLEEMKDSGEEISGLRTGLIDFDVLAGGLQPGQLVIVAARPKMGKTAFALQVAAHVALTAGGVGMFSLEMTDSELGPRLLASGAKVNTQKFRSGKLSENDWSDIAVVRAKLHEAPLHIDDTMHTTVGEIRAKARRLALQLEKEKKPLKLIVVDYLQLAGEYGEHREQEIAAISRGLKALAKELSIPVIALSQLNRALEKRPDKRPQPADLRDSGSLEQDADTVVFLYRDEVYHPNSSEKGTAELIISLQRGGPPGTAVVRFEEQFQKFSNLATQQPLHLNEGEKTA